MTTSYPPFDHEVFDPLEEEVEKVPFSLKAPTAYRTIGEVSTELNVPQHVLRFWEEKFPAIRPVKRGGGRRYYRLQDLDAIRRIKHLLYDKGYTIKGAQQVFKEMPSLTEEEVSESPKPANRQKTQQSAIKEIITELQAIRSALS